MRSGMLNLLNRLGGGKLYHCWFCRLQFYDVRQPYHTGRKAGQNLLGPPPDDPNVNFGAVS
jgi:hypothetical protein